MFGNAPQHSSIALRYVNASRPTVIVYLFAGNLRYEVMEKHKEAEINKRHQRGGQASTSRGADVSDLEPIPCILHLDPIANGGHETQTIGNALN